MSHITDFDFNAFGFNFFGRFSEFIDFNCQFKKSKKKKFYFSSYNKGFFKLYIQLYRLRICKIYVLQQIKYIQQTFNLLTYYLNINNIEKHTY